MLWFVDLPSGVLSHEQRLTLYDAPTRISLADGKVIITAGTAASPVSVVLDAPTR
jgi:hypothetical protein